MAGAARVFFNVKSQRTILQIQVNGAAREVEHGLRVSELVEQLKLRREQIVIELNHEVLRRAAWDETTLKNDDRVEIVHFVGGGCR
ncbi:MAG TPA: sulfur carrier protein ThiS [Pyrinomonadaceae bacterium]|nr:sulfur carrier protein ThiS [Pyrinomonadaceae bacterium]